jgi:hypothetical protein
MAGSLSHDVVMHGTKCPLYIDIAAELLLYRIALWRSVPFFNITRGWFSYSQIYSIREIKNKFLSPFCDLSD